MQNVKQIVQYIEQFVKNVANCSVGFCLLSSDDGAGLEFEGFFQIVEGTDNADFAFFGKFGGGGDFWKHGAGFEEALFGVIFGFFRGQVAERGLFRRAEVDVGEVDSGDGDEHVGLD